MLVRKGGRLGDNAGEGQHGETGREKGRGGRGVRKGRGRDRDRDRDSPAVLDLVNLVLGERGRVLAKTQGIKAEIAHVAPRALGLLEDGGTASELKHKADEKENTHASVGHCGVVCSERVGNRARHLFRAGEPDPSVNRNPPHHGKHGGSAMLDLALPHPLRRGELAGSRLGPDVGHYLLAPVLVQPVVRKAKGVKRGVPGGGLVDVLGRLQKRHALGLGLELAASPLGRRGDKPEGRRHEGKQNHGANHLRAGWGGVG